MEYKFKATFFRRGGTTRDESFEIRKTDTFKGVYMAAMEKAVELMDEEVENIDSIVLLGIR